MHILSLAKGLGDYGVIPLAVAGISIITGLSLLELDRRIHSSERIFKADKKVEREVKVIAVGFGCGILFSCLVLPRFLPFMQITPYGQPHFAWNKIEAYLNKV